MKSKIFGLNTVIESWEDKISQDFGSSLQPDAGEDLQTFYLRLRRTIFDDPFPLHRAARFGCERAIEIILNSGIDINAQDSNEFTALHYAAMKGHQLSVRLLLAKGANPEAINDGLSPLQLSLNKTGVGVIQFLPLHTLQPQDIVDLISAKKFFVLDELLKLNLDFHISDQQQRNCLHYACEALNPIDFDVDSRKESAFSTIQWLIAHGAITQVNAKDKNGITPLHIACGKTDIRAIDILLDHGADISALDQHGNTPIHWALWKGNPESLWENEMFHYKLNALYYGCNILANGIKFGIKVYSLKQRINRFTNHFISG